MREFDTGATRDNDENKLDYEAFLSPSVLERYARYMDKHRAQADGTLRSGDNWQKGIPKSVYIKSAWRHFFDWWREHRGVPSREGIEDAICALIFNASGYLHEHLKTKSNVSQGQRVFPGLSGGSTISGGTPGTGNVKWAHHGYSSPGTTSSRSDGGGVR